MNVRLAARVFDQARLTHGAAVNGTAASGGATALHAACERGDEYLVQLFSRLVPRLKALSEHLW